ncbi:ergot alkaloid biosynthesis protein [Fodinicola acaciae]|uniref:ergot alkaloid biosynthesis protein n=1 Tax=Fodinicola acaciae TaxID=2681555 RepID=UPI0013D6EFCE|nr:ergot alkaloid biosynthesis protein [Fodinicola acaciae]
MADILVVGATGTTGRRVAAGLRDRGVRPRLASRRPRDGHVRFAWSDRSTYAAALRGVDTVYLIAPPAELDAATLAADFLSAGDLRRVVVLGSSAVPDLAGVPGLVKEKVPEWAVLRPSWFMQNFTGDHPVARGVRAGEIVTATGDGRLGFVDARDIAAVAVRALTSDEPPNTEYVLTGPETLSYADAAAIIAAATGRPVRHRPVGVAELVDLLTAELPPAYAQMLAALDTRIQAGHEDYVTSTIEQVTGRPPRDFRSFVAEELR